MEHELLSLSSDSWTDAQQPNPCTPTFMDRAADRFSACIDTKVDSMMDRLEKRIDEKIDSKLGPVMDRLSELEKTSAAVQEVVPPHCLMTMVVVLDRAVPGVATAIFAPYLEMKGWCGFRDRNTHGLTEAQAREIIT